jgi:hypothetical protein
MNPSAYELSIPAEYGQDDVIGFESVYDAQEQLLDALDRCVSERSGWELRALLEEVREDIRAMEEPEDG